MRRTLIALLGMAALVGGGTHAAASVPIRSAENAARDLLGMPTHEKWLAPDRVVAGFGDADALSNIERVAHDHEGRLLRIDETLAFAVLEVEPMRRDALVDDLAALKGVRWAKVDGVAVASVTPDDPYFGYQWGADAVGLESAWDAGLGSHARVVAVVDTGVRHTHQDLAANYCTNGPDYVNGDADPYDDNGHGTHVAGTVAAAIGNGTGVAGMANACIMGLKVLDGGGYGFWSDVASGIAWATDNGAHVINLSLGGGPSPDLQSAVQYAWDAGVLVVAAAGNDYCSSVGYPAAYPEVMAVAALDFPGDARAPFSSCGPEVEIAAPGASVLSAWGTHDAGYRYLSGTSMATPHVAGAAALAWDHDPTLTNAEVRCILRDTADDLAPAGVDEEYGRGRLDVAGAVALPAPGTSCDGLWPEPTPPPPDGPCAFPCTENFDDGTANHWSLSGLWHVSSACDPAPPSVPSHLGYNDDATCTYDTGGANRGDGVLWLDLTGVDSGVLLEFMHRHETEGEAPYDAMTVEVSTDATRSWTVLARYTGDAPTLGWVPAAVDLSAYAGAVVQVRWRFDTLDAIYNGYLGWLIDNVSVGEHTDPQPPCGNNDARADACVIASLPYSRTQTTVSYTDDTGELPACWVGHNTAWFAYTHVGAPRPIEVDTNGSGFDTTLGVYVGPLEIACNDDYQNLQSRVSFLALPGVTYHVQAGGFLGDTGTLALTAQ